jgi:hypothetical protein
MSAILNLTQNPSRWNGATRYPQGKELEDFVVSWKKLSEMFEMKFLAGGTTVTFDSCTETP